MVAMRYIPSEIVCLGMIFGGADNIAVGQAFSYVKAFSQRACLTGYGPDRN